MDTPTLPTAPDRDNDITIPISTAAIVTNDIQLTLRGDQWHQIRRWIDLRQTDANEVIGNVLVQYALACLRHDLAELERTETP